LATLLGVSSELAVSDQGTNGNVVVAIRNSVQDTTNQVGQEMTRRNLSVQPTLTVRPTENNKLTFVCPVILKAELERYAAMHARAYGEQVDVATLIRGTPRRAAISRTDDAQSSGHGGVLRKSIKRADSPALSSNRAR